MSEQGSYNIYTARFLREKGLWDEFITYMNENPAITYFTSEEILFFEEYRGAVKH